MEKETGIYILKIKDAELIKLEEKKKDEKEDGKD